MEEAPDNNEKVSSPEDLKNVIDSLEFTEQNRRKEFDRFLGILRKFREEFEKNLLKGIGINK